MSHVGSNCRLYLAQDVRIKQDTPVGAGEGSGFGLGVVVVENCLAAADARVGAAARLPAAARSRQRLALRPDQATGATSACHISTRDRIDMCFVCEEAPGLLQCTTFACSGIELVWV